MCKLGEGGILSCGWHFFKMFIFITLKQRSPACTWLCRYLSRGTSPSSTPLFIRWHLSHTRPLLSISQECNLKCERQIQTGESFKDDHQWVGCVRRGCLSYLAYRVYVYLLKAPTRALLNFVTRREARGGVVVGQASPGTSSPSSSSASSSTSPHFSAVRSAFCLDCALGILFCQWYIWKASIRHLLHCNCMLSSDIVKELTFQK